MNNDITVVKDSLPQSHLDTDNQQDENIKQNQSDSATSKHVIGTAKKDPMHPTQLYISVFLRL